MADAVHEQRLNMAVKPNTAMMRVQEVASVPVVATIEVGTVTTGEPGANASVTNVGTKKEAVLDFVIPRGATGMTGDDGVTFTPAVSADGVLSWTNDGERENPDSVNLKGPQGIQGVPGDNYVLTDADKADIAADVIEKGVQAEFGPVPLPAPATAAVGQIVKVKAVDASGKITETEAVDLPSGGADAWEKIADVAFTADTSLYELANFGVYRKVKVLMSRAAHVSGLSKNVWFYVKTAAAAAAIASVYLTSEYGYVGWEIDAEVGETFTHVEKYTTNNRAGNNASNSKGVDVLSPANPSEYSLYIKFVDTSVIQDGDTVAVYGVKR